MFRIIDIHTHILPGVDDGAGNWKDTLQLMQTAYAQGTIHMIATPHYSSRVDIDKLVSLRDQAQKLAQNAGLELTVSLGQEILYFEDLPIYLEQGKALSLAGSRYVLVEFQPNDSYQRVWRAVRELVQTGYFPIIAHAERYRCLREDSRVEELIDSGAYLQANAGSILGGILDKTAFWCRRAVMQGRIHFLASDMHNIGHRPPRLEAAAERLAKQLSPAQIQGIVGNNQVFILKDRMQ